MIGTGKNSHTYFAIPAANSDQIQHVQMPSQNTFAFEASHGGVDRNFTDVVMSFQPLRLIAPDPTS
ncbi:MAG: hypothetical protein ACKOXO_11745 [Cyanobium sp.]